MSDADQPNVPRSRSRSNLYYSLVIVAAFFGAGLFGIVHHEMWRDELQAWLIARDTDLLISRHALGYDGHPILWYLVLYCITRLTHNPFWMQAIHLLIATGAVSVFVFYSPLGRLQKALFAFGYFPLYEYAAISRNYSLGVLLVFCFCALFSTRRYIYLACVLALLANTSAYGLLVSGALALLLIFEVIEFRNRIREVIFASVIYLAGVFYSLWIMKGVSDSGNVLAWRFWGRLIDVGLAVGIVWRGFFPIPGDFTYFWNKNFVTSWELGAILGVVVLVATALVFRGSKRLLLAYLVGVGAIVAFTFVKFYGSIRHHGHVFILFVACYWLLHHFKKPIHKHFVTGLFALHVVIALVALRADFAHPFSNSKKVADYLRAQGLENVFIVADRDTVVSPITAYLDHRVYYPRGDREGTFIIWDQTRLNSTPPNSFDIARSKAQTVLVITNTKQSASNTKLLAEFTGSLAEDENYFLYLVEAK